MLHVKTYVAASRIHGLGLFADEPIAKGQVIWTLEPPIDQLFSREQVERMPQRMRDFLSRYAFCVSDHLVLGGDDDRFTNHSDSPNCVDHHELHALYARRDISRGEELTEDYHEMGRPWDAFQGLVTPEFTGMASRSAAP
jgi:uncharacterized protein